MLTAGETAMTTLPGVRVKIPNGKKLVDLVRENMDVSPRSATRDQLGVSRDVFILTRRLLILRDRQILTDDEEKIVDQAIRTMEEGFLEPAKLLIRPLFDRLWQKGTRSGQFRDRGRNPDKKLYERLERTVFTVGEVCTNLDQVQIPSRLSRKQRADAENTLIESITSLSAMLAKIRRGPSHD